MLSRLRNHRLHHFLQNVHSGLSCSGNGLLDNGACKAVDLNIHLDGCDTVLCTAYLKVHIAEEVLQTLDIGENDIIIIGLACYQTAGNTRYHLLNRYACCH